MRNWFVAALVVAALAGPVSAAEEEPKVDPAVAALAGVWEVAEGEGYGVRVGQIGFIGSQFTIRGDAMEVVKEPVLLNPRVPIYANPFAVHQGTSKYTLRASKAKDGATVIDWVRTNGMAMKTRYELKGDELTVRVVNWMACRERPGRTDAQDADEKPRPEGLKANDDGETVRFVLKRVRD